jgi:hypothetical protein
MRPVIDSAILCSQAESIPGILDRLQIRALKSAWLYQGVTRDVVYLGLPIATSYMSPNAGGMGGVAGSQPMSTAVQCTMYIGSQINFGDLTPYLTYGLYMRKGNALHKRRRQN